MNERETIKAAYACAAFEKMDLDLSLSLQGDGRLFIAPDTLRSLSERAFTDIAFYLRRSHLAALSELLEDPSSSANDLYVIETLLRNALIASRRELPLCQDTGTATLVGWKDEGIHTGVDDCAEIEEGARRAYARGNLRSSQVASLTFFKEFDTGNNLPAQVHLEASPDGEEGPALRLLFVAKGGGSANKTSLFQMTKALLEKEPFEAFLREKVAALGVAACPPYRLCVVVGGTSAEENLRILKLATTEILDAAPLLPQKDEKPSQASAHNCLKRDPYWEQKLGEIAQESGLGAQFGGSALALDTRVFRLPRHAGSCPVSMGVSCSAHRNALAYIDASGVWLEALEKNPAEYLLHRGGRSARIAEAFLANKKASSGPEDHRIDLDKGMREVCSNLHKLKVGDRVLLNGSLLVARDAAHLKWHELLAEGKELPSYLKEHPIYYAGPADTPEGKAIGSFGPTTAQRMDAYAEELMSEGASLITLAKGNRAQSWTAACKKYGGFYLGTVGGAAALLAEENILSSSIIDYSELGMEAVRLIMVRDLVAFIITDDKGNDLFSTCTTRFHPTPCPA
ncbi:fumarate hydratase [Treponema sp.]